MFAQLFYRWLTQFKTDLLHLIINPLVVCLFIFSSEPAIELSNIEINQICKTVDNFIQITWHWTKTANNPTAITFFSSFSEKTIFKELSVQIFLESLRKMKLKFAKLKYIY